MNKNGKKKEGGRKWFRNTSYLVFWISSLLLFVVFLFGFFYFSSSLPSTTISTTPPSSPSSSPSPSPTSSSTTSTSPSSTSTATAKASAKKVAPSPSQSIVEVLERFPHDKNAFTQGLMFYKNELYESTGLHGSSTLRKVDLQTGKVTKLYSFPKKYFGEGMTIVNDTIYVLTWKNKIGFVFDLDFNLIKNFSYKTQGWGLTHNDKHLIMSDGTNKLYFLSPSTLTVEKVLPIMADGGQGKMFELKLLNELEFINGYIYANVWGSTVIAVIDIENGFVVHWLNCELLKKGASGEDVLNGIAYNHENQQLYVTGKLWDELYRIRLPDWKTETTTNLAK